MDKFKPRIDLTILSIISPYNSYLFNLANMFQQYSNLMFVKNTSIFYWEIIHEQDTTLHVSITFVRSDTFNCYSLSPHLFSHSLFLLSLYRDITVAIKHAESTGRNRCCPLPCCDLYCRVHPYPITGEAIHTQREHSMCIYVCGVCV